MKIKDHITQYLKEQPKARERAHKDRAIVNLLIVRYPSLGVAIQSGVMSKNLVIALVQDYASYDRAWRQALEQNPQLRGKDYHEKDRLEQEKQIELGYSPTHHADSKILSKLK